MHAGTIALALLTVVLLQYSVDALLSNGRNVCRHTRVESYTAQQRYKTKCGFLGWKRCTRHRTVTRTRSVPFYKCCPNWHSVNNQHCDKAQCFGLPVGTCSNGGTCVRPGVCTCRAGFTTPRCTDINECAKGNGGCQHSCTNSHGSFRCSCNSGFGLLSDRKSCKPVCFGLSPGSCANGGTCVGPNSCTCPSGFSRPQCADIDECRNNNGGCSQICDNVPGSYRCRCQSGYGMLSDGKSCKPQCHGAPLGTCQNGGTCVKPNVCTCPVGFAAPRCDDINECNNNNGGCSQVCTNTPGSFRCSCESGYGLIGGSDCKPICFGAPPGTCPNGGKCVSPGRCSCKQGFAGSPCADVDECSRNNGGCSQNCHNTVGSFTCSCNAGYQLAPDGRSCLAICHGLPAGTCQNGGKCIQPDVCECGSGFTAPNCEDINECLTSNGGCDGDCENTVGSFICKCSSGYHLAADGKTCSDIDECAQGTSGCSHFCVNEPGSFHCNCPLGYVLSADQKTCEDVNECDENNGGCSQTCSNTVGSFQCSCQDGFVLDQDGKTCHDTSNCGEKLFVWCWPECTQSGSECVCPPGHVLHQNGINCVDPCFSRPCQHGGKCNKPSSDATTFTCDCTNTGYIGENCETGVVSLPANIRVRAGVLSDSIVLTAFPERELILTAVHGSDLKVFPNQIFIRSPATSASFKILAAKSGKYSIGFQASGQDAASFSAISPFEILADDVFSKYQIPFKGLPEGSFFIDLSFKGNDFRFTSTSAWYRLNSDQSIFFTKGIAFSEVGNASVPLSVKGLEVRVRERLTVGPSSNLRDINLGTAVSGEVVRMKRQAPFELSVKDINDFIENNSILRALFFFIRPLLPDWINLFLDTNSPDPFFFAQISPGSTIQKLPYCAGAPLFDDRVYHVFRFTHAIIVTILNQELYLPKTDNEQYCLILDLNKDYGSTLVVMFPDKAARLLEEMEVFKKMKEKTGISVYPNGFGISLFRNLNVRPIESELEFWNGDEMFNYPLSETATFWASVKVGKSFDPTKNFDFAIAPVPIETYVALPDVRKILSHVFIDPWEVYLRSIGEPLEITIHALILKKKYPISFSTGNIVQHNLQAYGSVGGVEDRQYCGPTARPPGFFTAVFVDAKLLRGVPIIQDLLFNTELEAQFFYRLDDVDIGKVPKPIDIIRNLVGQIKQAATELLAFVVAEIQKYVNVIAPVILEIIQTFRQHLQTLVSIVTDFLDSFNLQALVANVADLVRDVVASVNNLVQQVRRLVDQLEIMFEDTLKNFVDFVKRKVEEIRTSALTMVRKLYDETVGIFKGTKSLGVRGYFSITVLGLELGIEGEFVQSDAHLRRCGDLVEIYDHMQGEAAWRAFGVIDAFKIGIGKGGAASKGKASKKIWSLLSVRLGFGFGLALASESNNFVVRLHARLNFFGAKATADVFVTNREIASRTQLVIWDIFTARLTIRATVFVDLPNWALQIRGEFIPGGGRKRQAGNSVQASLGDAIRKFVNRLADEAVKRINKAQDAVNKAKGKLTDAQRWLDEKKAAVDKANVVFDKAVAGLEKVKQKLEAAKGPFKRALEKLKKAQKRVDNLCKIRDCPKICIPGIKFKKCKIGWGIKVPCPRWTKCMIKVPNVLCIGKNVLCRALRAAAFLALEAAKLFVRVPMLALDAAKAAVSVAQVVVDKSRVILEVVKLAFDAAKGLLQVAKGALSVANAALEVVKFAVRAVQFAINFIVKYGLQSIIDIGACGFEIELSTRDLFEFEIFCEVNPFRLGWRTVRFRLNFRNIFGSIWNAAKSLVNSFLDSIKGILGRRKREIDYEAFSRLHKVFRARRQSGNGTLDESIFENVEDRVTNNTVLTNTTAESEILFWQEQCGRYQPVISFLRKSIEELQNATYVLEESLAEVETRGAETMDILNSIVSASVDDSEIDYNIAEEDFNVSRETVNDILNHVNSTLQDDDLIRESKSSAEYIVNENEASKDSFSRVEILPLWRDRMENESLAVEECSGFYDCVVWSFGELYQLVDSTDPQLLPEAQTTLPQLEELFYSLFENDTKTFKEVKEIFTEILNKMRMINADDVFCGTVPEITANPSDIKASAGSDITLTCMATSVPAPTFYWYRNEELLASGPSFSSLILNAVSSVDNGEYVCVAGNHVANTTSDPARVTVVYPPRMLSDLPARLEVIVGDEVAVLCNVSASPEANITWHKSDATFSVQNSSLVFSAVKLADAGVYWCVSTNEYGSVMSSQMTLVVEDASPLCPSLSFRFAFITDSEEGVLVNETLLQRRVDGVPLEEAFSEVILLIINSTEEVSVDINFVQAQSEANVILSTGCRQRNCTPTECAALYQEAFDSLQTSVAHLEMMISSDQALFIRGDKVYNFNPSLIVETEESNSCPSGFKENDRQICVKFEDNAPKNFRIGRQIAFGTTRVIILKWEPVKKVNNGYEVEVSNNKGTKQYKIHFTSFGMLVQRNDGETTVRVRAFLPAGPTNWAQLVVPKVNSGTKGDNRPVFRPR